MIVIDRLELNNTHAIPRRRGGDPWKDSGLNFVAYYSPQARG